MKKTGIAYLIYFIIVWIFFLWLYPGMQTDVSLYACIGHALYFTRLPLLPLLLFWIWRSSLFRRAASRLENSRLPFILTVFIYLAMIAAFYGIVQLPFRMTGFLSAHYYGISVQPWTDWLKEYSIDLILLWAAAGVVVSVTLLLIRRLKHWWIALWILLVPAAIFMVYVQPVWIDPIYEDFQPLRQGELRTSMEELTAEAGIGNADLLEVAKSEKTTTYNAYVTGIWSNARVVIWDTTMEGLTEDEVLFIVAHEIGHYIGHHVYWGTAGFLVLGLVLLFLTYLIYSKAASRKREQSGSVAAVPLLLGIAASLQLITQPISLYVSREMEYAADSYAIEHAPDLAAGAVMFEKMNETAKSDTDPPAFITWLRFTHPPISERIDRIENIIASQQNRQE